MSNIHSHVPDSSVISYYAWEEYTELLYIEFRTNSIWVYHNVSRPVYEAMAAADSVGAFFNTYIRNSPEFYAEKIFAEAKDRTNVIAQV